MRLLILTARPPYPADSGGRIRLWAITNHLAKRHDLTIVCFREPGEPPRSEAFDAIGVRLVTVPHSEQISEADAELLRMLPPPVRSYARRVMCDALIALEPTTFDWVLFDTVYLTAYRELFERALLLEQNIESEMVRQYAAHTPAPGAVTDPRERLFWRGTARSLEQYEDRVWARFPLRVVVSAADRAALDRRCSAGRTIIVENGVDLLSHPLVAPPTARTVMLTGALDYIPNVEAAFQLVKNIMPHVWRQDPGVRVLIAGRRPHPALANFQDPRVQIIANPPDMLAIAAQAGCLVVPLSLGGGTRLKILEAFAWGVPVVSTSLGCRGLDATDGENILIRDEPAALASAVLDLLASPALTSHLRANGRALVERRYDWNTILKAFETELENA